MTNIFGINITENRKNKAFDDSVFVTQTLSARADAEKGSLMEGIAAMDSASELSAPLSILYAISRLGAAILIVAIFRALASGRSLATVYHNAPYFFWLAGVFALLAAALWRLKKKKEEQIPQEEVEELAAQQDAVLQRIREEFAIPDSAKSVDFLSERYVMKQGKAKNKGFFVTEYETVEALVFVRGGSLCLADTTRCLSIPLSDFAPPKLMKKHVSFSPWNKQEEPDSPAYKPFVRTNQMGACFARYYRVEIRDPRGEYYLLIPEYDMETFGSLTRQPV